MKRHLLGTDMHEDIADTFTCMSAACASMNKQVQGIKYCREALRIYELTLTNTYNTMDNAGNETQQEHPKIANVKKQLQDHS